MTAAGSKLLVVLIDGQRVGSIAEGHNGRLELRYDETWRTLPTATPLSLSMPIAESRHRHSAVAAFLWGLLPDSEQVLDRWARQFHVSARNPFALLRHVGEDCAGAAQFVVPDRVDALLAGEGGVEWVDEDQVAHRLRTLRRDPAAWHMATAGQFSLAGAQAKTALHFDPQAQRWGDPWGAMPTTHILKPAVVGFDEHDLNEHLCLETANLLGMDCARSVLRALAGERAIIIERYDRFHRTGGTIRRVHQEDMCQALGVPPTEKYQSDGGPTPEHIVELLRREVRPGESAAREIGRFVDALAFNWIVGGTDAHAKNYSVLLSGGQVRLAPLYDVASALPYDDMYLPKLRSAMRIGGEYHLAAVSGRHWRRFAEANRLDPDTVVTRLEELVARTPDALATAVQAPAVRALGSELPARLLDRVTARAQRCQRALSR